LLYNKHVLVGKVQNVLFPTITIKYVIFMINYLVYYGSSTKPKVKKQNFFPVVHTCTGVIK